MKDFLKFDWKEIAAVALIFILAFGIGSFPPKSTLPEYSSAIKIQDASLGRATEPHIQLAYLSEGIYAPFSGLPIGSPDTTVSFLLLLPPVLFGLTGVFLYLALRTLGFRKTIAAFSSVLFVLSPLAIIQFLPGVFNSLSVALPLFSLSLVFSAVYSKSKNLLWLLLSAASGAFCAYVDSGAGVAALSSLILFFTISYLKNEKNAPSFAVAAFAIVAVLFIAPKPLVFSGMGGVGALLTNASFLAAAASCTLMLYFTNVATVESLLVLICALIVSVFSPLSGAILLAIPAAEGISRASEEKIPKISKLACASSIFFFAIFGLASEVYSDFSRLVVFSILLSFLAPLLMHLYGYKGRQFFAVSALSLVGLSLAIALFQPLASAEFLKYSDADEAAAFSYLAANGETSVCFLGNEQLAKFYLPDAEICDKGKFSEYLRIGQPRPNPNTTMIISLSYFDLPSVYGLYKGTAPFESFAHLANISDEGGKAVIFSSKSGQFLLREIDEKGEFALKDGRIIDRYGNSYAVIPLSRMVLLRPEIPLSNQNNRVLVMEEGETLPHFFDIYSGTLSSITPSESFGKIGLYKVE